MQCNTITLFACTETKLDSSIPTNIYNIPNYHTIRIDRVNNIKKSGGGLVTFVSHIFNYEIIECNIKFPNLVEVLIIKISSKFIKPVIVVIIYRNPETLKSKFLECFTELIISFSQYKYEKIYMGDFNCNLLHYIDKFDIDTHKLYLLCKSFNLWQLISGPTFQGKSLLDHMYVTDKHNYPTVGHFSFGGSDHDLCFIRRRIGKVKIPPMKCLVRSLKDVDWRDFEKHILEFKFSN